MTRSLKRVFSGAVILWFGLLMTRPDLAHHCPAHEGRPGGMAATGHMAHHSSSGMPGHSGHQHCTCPGACCPGTTPAMIQPAGLRWLATATAERERPAPGRRLVAPRADHILPFATAPPPIPTV